MDTKGNCVFSPQQELHANLLVGPGHLVEGSDLRIIPESSFLWDLDVVVHHDDQTHLQLLPPEQGPRTRPDVLSAHLHHAVFRVAGERGQLQFISHSQIRTMEPRME